MCIHEETFPQHDKDQAALSDYSLSIVLSSYCLPEAVLRKGMSEELHPKTAGPELHQYLISVQDH